MVTKGFQSGRKDRKQNNTNVLPPFLCSNNPLSGHDGRVGGRAVLGSREWWCLDIGWGCTLYEGSGLQAGAVTRSAFY